MTFSFPYYPIWGCDEMQMSLNLFTEKASEAYILSGSESLKIKFEKEGQGAEAEDETCFSLASLDESEGLSQV